jgi:hypothetical protein
VNGHEKWSKVRRRPRLTEARLNEIQRHKSVAGNISAAMADELIAELTLLRGTVALAEAERAAMPPTGYWCCAFDWNRGLYRTSACVERTAGDDPLWEKVEGRTYATPDESAIEALKDPRIRAAAETLLAEKDIVIADGTRGMERGR